ncbi:CHAT domain-containing protein [Anabaena sp. UHCC 0399]|uniref:CHAT domain-containing protein n=1 Tax=Anabaena sp. UHCC 0399 TaxID=3110238 RepID=UPI002B210027|nr:tetratricopeptide repeat protein [Anabaena sp. UHCC 0399]MEA5565707.1 tetratricopeptide repeat protein [Anabaena sp. UHCC 0399]
MLTRLLQWFKTIETHPVASNQIGSFKAAREEQVVELPPALTNADLELLFTQLLEGVYQGRGQQWAIKFLQRMEDRISIDRWIDWLLVFGEKLLLSPAPNHLVATKMVQLGELDIGKVGELSYEIGIQLLNRDSDELPQEYQQLEVSETTEIAIDSPGQALIRNLGDLLWETEEPEMALKSENEENTQILAEGSPQFWTDVAEEGYTETTEESFWQDPPQATEVVEESYTENWQYQPQEIEFVAPSEPVVVATIENLAELSWEYLPQEIVVSTEAIAIPAEEDVISNLSEVVFDDSATASGAVVLSTQAHWDQSLANLEPDVADTLDELLVRLDQSTSLVQHLAANLAVQPLQLPAITGEFPSPLVQAQAWFYQGLQQAKSGNLAEAIASYEQAIQLNPHSHEYWFNRGLTLFHLERLTEAIASYDQAIALKPDYYKAWYNRGGTLGQLGLFEEAIASFQQAIAIHPDNPEVWASKGWAELKTGQITEAIASYDQSLQLEPQDAENWYYRGIALSVNEQNQAAIASYNNALEIQPDFHEAWIDRGVVLFNLKQWSEAIASWDKALASQPDFYLAWYNRGIALDNLMRREEAIASYQQAIAIKPDFHLAWYNQAVALFHLERYLEAISSYDNALKIKLDYWEAWIGRGTSVGQINTDDLNLLTAIALTHPALNQGSYAGKIASYEEGLKHIRSDTHPEGWGRLHLAIGNSYYEQGKKQQTSRNYWRKALTEYNQALLTLTSQDFPQLHLDVLQSLIKTLLGLRQSAQAQDLLQRGTNLLQQLLREPTRSDDSKKQLALKLAGLAQMVVDITVENGDLVEAWEIAEQGKNSCLNFLLFGGNSNIAPLNYSSIQTLLNPQTAIIYWHISPAALHTFIIKDQAPSPILVFTPIKDVEPNSTPLQDLPLPEASRRLIAFENWLEDWQRDYQEYRLQAQDQTSKSNHTWRLEMEARLWELKNILEIDTIIQELEDITQLILVPHRDLQRLPIHTLFQINSEEQPNLESNFSITYLPNIQIGLSIRTANIWDLQEQALLSIEYPTNSNHSTFKFANLESEIVSQMFNEPHRIQAQAATKENVENNLFDRYFSNYNVFHFAGQVINNLTEPSKSEIALAGEDKITLAEIIQGNLETYNLVTLSACDTTITSPQIINSEYVSLVNGFLAKGVPSVLSTLWTVESSASALVIIEFYRRLKLLRSPNLALSAATKWLRELTAWELTQWYEELLNQLHPEELKIRSYVATHLYRISKMEREKKLYSHPYYWAAFIITGKPIQSNL